MTSTNILAARIAVEQHMPYDGQLLRVTKVSNAGREVVVAGEAHTYHVLVDIGTDVAFYVRRDDGRVWRE